MFLFLFQYDWFFTEDGNGEPVVSKDISDINKLNKH